MTITSKHLAKFIVGLVLFMLIIFPFLIYPLGDSTLFLTEGGIYLLPLLRTVMFSILIFGLPFWGLIELCIWVEECLKGARCFTIRIKGFKIPRQKSEKQEEINRLYKNLASYAAMKDEQMVEYYLDKIEKLQ